MTLLIVFNDGTERRIENVHSYEYAKGTGCFQYSLNKSTSFAYIPKEGLKYIGPEEFWVEQEKKSNADLDELIQYFQGYRYDDPGTPFARGVNAAIDMCIGYCERLKM